MARDADQVIIPLEFLLDGAQSLLEIFMPTFGGEPALVKIQSSLRSEHVGWQRCFQLLQTILVRMKADPIQRDSITTFLDVFKGNRLPCLGLKTANISWPSKLAS